MSAGLRLLTDSDNDSTQTVRAPKLMGRVVSCHPNVYLKESEYKSKTSDEKVLAAAISVRIVRNRNIVRKEMAQLVNAIRSRPRPRLVSVSVRRLMLWKGQNRYCSRREELTR